jgi:DNA-binding NarL/FixJ family response regulator
VTFFLLVEDDPILARGLMRALALRRIRARHVSRCATAAALRGPFVVGVFDIDLPDGDGVALAELLCQRQVVLRPVFFTACTQPRRLERARALGPVFVKSGNLEPLIDLLKPEALDPRIQAFAVS